MVKIDKLVKGLEEIKTVQEAIIRVNANKKYKAVQTKRFKKTLEDAIAYIHENEDQKKQLTKKNI